MTGKISVVTAVILVGVLIAGAIYVGLNGMPISQQVQPGPQGSGGQLPSATCAIEDSALSVAGKDLYAKALVNLNAELKDAAGDSVISETNANAAMTSMGTSFNPLFSGTIYVGNDNYVSTSDRGTEYYYVSKPVSWNCKAMSTETIDTYAEDTAFTVEYYDAGTYEATANETVTTTPVTNSYVRIVASDNKAIGNPTIPNSFGICINVTTPSGWNSIKPSQFIETFNTPEYLTGMNVLGCYRIGNALVDGGDKVIYLTFDPASDPGVSEAAYIIPIDTTHYKDDALKFQVGDADISSSTLDTDIGMSALALAAVVNFN